EAGRGRPVGWVRGRLEAGEGVVRAGDEPVELERGGARLLVRVDRFRPAAEELPVAVDEDGQLALFAELPTEPPPRGIELQPLQPVPAPPLHRVRRLSYSAIALFERCSYRFYAERIAGLRARRPAGGAGEGGLLATELGGAVPRLQEA